MPAVKSISVAAVAVFVKNNGFVGIDRLIRICKYILICVYNLIERFTIYIEVTLYEKDLFYSVIFVKRFLESDIKTVP